MHISLHALLPDSPQHAHRTLHALLAHIALLAHGALLAHSALHALLA